MKTTVWVSGLIGALLLGLVTIASADVTYEQSLSESDNYGFLSNIDGDMSADNFTITSSILIQSVTWYGAYEGGGSNVSDSFDIRIYNLSGVQMFGALGITGVNKTYSGFNDAYDKMIYKYEIAVSGWELAIGDYLISISNGNFDFSNWFWADGTGGDGIHYYWDSASWMAEDTGVDMAFTLNGVSTQEVVPNKTTLISPSNTIVDTSPTFTWGEISNATWYKIYFKNISTGYKFVQWYEIEDNFSKYPETNCTSGECKVILDFQLESGEYEWWARTWNGNGNGEWSEGMSFTVQSNDSPPSKVTHSSPSGSVQDSTPTYTWNEDPASTWYKFWVGSPNGDRIFAQWYDAADICSGGNCSVTLELELPDGSYGWYVKSWNDNGKVWSDGMSFTVSE